MRLIDLLIWKYPHPSLLLLRSPWKVAGWLIWLEDEIDAAIALFNKTIMHQVSVDAKTRQEAKGQGEHREQASSSRSESEQSFQEAEEEEEEEEEKEECASGDLASALSRQQSNDNLGHTSEAASSIEIRREEGGRRRALEIRYPDKSGLLFSRFIFSFNSIFKTLQDLHILPRAAFEAAKILKRLQVPYSPRLKSVGTSEPDDVFNSASSIINEAMMVDERDDTLSLSAFVSPSA